MKPDAPFHHLHNIFRNKFNRVVVRIILILALSPLPCALSHLSAQVPRGFNYQAIARDGSGNPIIGATIDVKFAIQADTTAFPVVFWEEQHSNVKTNAFGMYTLVIGTGTQTGGQLSSFGDIDWSVSPKFLKTQIFYQSAWKYMGSSGLWSVPYSMVAGGLDGSLNRLEVVGEDTQSDEALFEVKRKDGETMFAVYNHGVRVYMPLDTLSKSRKGGFAIGGFDKAKGTVQDYFVVNPDSIRAYIETNPGKGVKGGFAIGGFNRSKTAAEEYLRVTPDSIRAYIDTNPGKGVKGGFAIGGFDKSKAANEEYLRVTRDSTRIYVNESTKGVKGGFAIGGFGPDKGSIIPFTSLTPDNYFIGHNSGAANTDGLYNIFLGYESGLSNKTGSDNALFGFQSGYSNTSGSSNLFLGYQSGYSNTTGNYNSFMGYKSGFLNTTGDKNAFIGSYAGVNNTAGSNNTFSGYNSGYSNKDGQANNFYGTGSGYLNTSGSNNIFIGPESGYNNSTGSYNTFIGYRAGYNNSANNNVFIGNECGYSNSTGTVNVFIGYSAGRSNTTGTGNVFMGNGAGISNIDGGSNVFIGQRSGFTNDTGTDNVYIGYQAGYKGTSAYSNVAIGHQSGYELTLAYQNVFVGHYAGKNTTYGESNVFVGNSAGLANMTGGSNVHIGAGAGEKANASNNAFVGWGSGYENTSGTSNTFLGTQAGFNNTTGSNNVALGNGAGYANSTGQGNIFIGNYAGYYETGSNKLHIDNKITTTPLIYGDFNSRYLTVNGDANVAGTYFRLVTNPGTGTAPASYMYQGSAGSTTKQYALAVRDALWVTGPSWFDNYIDIGISGVILRAGGDEALWYNGTYYSWGFSGSYNYFAKPVTIGNTNSPSYMLYVQGTTYSSGGYAGSDIRWKTNLRPLANVTPSILKLKGYTYNWRTDEYPDMHFDSDTQIGLVAQEVEKVFPELVKTDSDGYKAVSYEKLTVILLEGLKEQQKRIESQENRIEKLEQLVNSLMSE
jgi:hypothetical protein